jgi:hypothetical protein
LHVHFVIGQYVRHALVRDAWRRGIVDIRRIAVPARSSPARESSRAAARYLAKYVSKSADDGRAVGAHRYEVAQGFQPRAVRLFDRDPDSLIERASARMGVAPA